MNPNNQLKPLWKASSKKVTLIQVPDLKYLMYDGHGYVNNSPDFMQGIGLLFGLSYTLKFMLKFMPEIQPAGYTDYKVATLEALYWSPTGCFDPADDTTWNWTVMIAQPDFIERPLVELAAVELEKKKKVKGNWRIETLPGSLAAQYMHIGPYQQVGDAYFFLSEGIDKMGYQPVGKHHEIYLNDPNRTTPEKLKTVVRFNVKPKNL